MSTRILLLEKISNMLDESIDIDKVKSIPLKLDDRVSFEHDGYEYGMMIQKIENENRSIFPKIFTLPKNLEGYYNFGFDVNGLTAREETKSYKEIAKPLSIIIKSLLDWMQNNNPYLITVFADSKTTEEKVKKIGLYGTILHREKNRLESLGYYWDFFNSPSYGKSIYLKKLNK